MRNIPSALQTHIEGEVTSLTRCVKITRKDGVVLRLTTHDSPLSVNGDLYRADIPVEFSAIESTDSLTVDNAEMTIGLDDTVVRSNDIDAGLFDEASFELFTVNWEDTSEGTVQLKRGTFGDIEITDELSAKIQLRGLSYLLQRPIVEKYSLTCRTALGGARCGYVNIPLRVRRNNQKVKTFDWFVAPSANITTPAFSNGGFESGLTGWTVGSGSTWTAETTLTPFAGAQYAYAGAGSVGAEHALYRDMTTSALSMSDTDVDDGKFTFDFSAQVAGTSATYSNPCKLFIEQFDAAGATLKRDETPWITPDNEVWEGVGVAAFVLPSCRSIRIGVTAKVVEGSAGYIAVDASAIRYWTNESSTWGGAVFRTVRLPAYARNERLALDNTSFETDGEVGNTNAGFTSWTAGAGDYWRIVSSIGALSPYSGDTFLFGGDNGSTTAAQVYTLTQSVDTPRDLGPIATRAQRVAYEASKTLADEATAANIAAGWYYCEIRARVAVTDAVSEPRILVSFLDGTDTLISTLDTGYVSGLTQNVWTELTKGVRVPSGTASIAVGLYAKSGSGSAANAAFDSVEVYVMPTAFENDADSEQGFLADSQPTLDYTNLNYTKDGDAVIQAKTPNFGYGTVTAVTDKRTFTVAALTDTSVNLYSGRVVWLSGANAGRTSYIRVWNDGTKVMRVYDFLPETIAIGDTFVYGRGCDKTIGACADLFGNAHNFRGEPYLPGPSKVITFLTATK